VVIGTAKNKKIKNAQSAFVSIKIEIPCCSAKLIPVFKDVSKLKFSAFYVAIMFQTGYYSIILSVVCSTFYIIYIYLMMAAMVSFPEVAR